MLKHLSIVILLALSIVFVFAPGDFDKQQISVGQVNADGGSAEFNINVKIQQLCCQDGQCTAQTQGKKCQGHFQMILDCEAVSGSTSVPVLNSSKNQMVISLNDNKQLFKSIDEAVTEQYASKNIGVPKGPREIRVGKAKQINPVTYPLEFVTEKDGYQEKLKLPQYVRAPPMDIVAPIGFTLDEVEIIRKEVLYKINYYRSMFALRDLYLEKNLDQYSQNWANTLALNANHMSNSTLEYSNSKLYGEVLFTSYPLKYVGEVAVDFCFYEVAHVNFTRDHDDGDVFRNEKTKCLYQLLWMQTNDIGVGAAIGTDGKFYVVINFNQMGAKLYFMIENVPKFTKDLKEDARKSLDRIHKRRSELLRDLGVRVSILPGWRSILYGPIRT